MADQRDYPPCTFGVGAADNHLMVRCGGDTIGIVKIVNGEFLAFRCGNRLGNFAELSAAAHAMLDDEDGVEAS